MGARVSTYESPMGRDGLQIKIQENRLKKFSEYSVFQTTNLHRRSERIDFLYKSTTILTLF